MASGLLKPLISAAAFTHYSHPSFLGLTVPITLSNKPQIKAPSAKMATQPNTKSNSIKIIDSHLHVWASPQEVTQTHYISRSFCFSFFTKVVFVNFKAKINIFALFFHQWQS